MGKKGKKPTKAICVRKEMGKGKSKTTARRICKVKKGGKR